LQQEIEQEQSQNRKENITKRIRNIKKRIFQKKKKKKWCLERRSNSKIYKWKRSVLRVGIY